MRSIKGPTWLTLDMRPLVSLDYYDGDREGFAYSRTLEAWIHFRVIWDNKWFSQNIFAIKKVSRNLVPALSELSPTSSYYLDVPEGIVANNKTLMDWSDYHHRRISASKIVFCPTSYIDDSLRCTSCQDFMKFVTSCNPDDWEVSQLEAAFEFKGIRPGVGWFPKDQLPKLQSHVQCKG